MTTRARVFLLILGLLATGVLIFLPWIADNLAAYKTNRAAGKNATFADSLSHLNRASSRIPIPSKNASMHRSPPMPPWDILGRATAHRRMYAVKPASIKVPAWQGVLAQSGPKTRELFETGMSYLRNGRYVEARLAFQTLVRTYPGDKAQALAYWAMGLSFYKEGGDANLLMASDQLRNFLIFFPGEPGLEDLAEAAQMNIAVIETEMMDYAQSEKQKINAAKITSQALTQFLKAYPDSLEAPAAQIHLVEIQWYLVGAERK
jgi:TolA-binding protein